MSNSSVYLYEFLYRGQRPGSEQAPDYHVILAETLRDAFGNTSVSVSRAMTPEQAKAAGFDLPDIVSAIDAVTMAENAALKDRLAAMEGSRGSAEDQVAREA